MQHITTFNIIVATWGLELELSLPQTKKRSNAYHFVVTFVVHSSKVRVREIVNDQHFVFQKSILRFQI